MCFVFIFENEFTEGKRVKPANKATLVWSLPSQREIIRPSQDVLGQW